MEKTFTEGIYPVYKPSGPTSNDLVMRMKKITGEKKVGHAGTLDPLAEGVLVIAVGRRFTKKIGAETNKEKEYLAEIELGKESCTDDGEGPMTKIAVKHKPLEKEVKKCLLKFIGKIQQIPPEYSAVKVRGREAYKRMRKGESFKLEAREVEIKEIELVNYKWPIIKVKVVCGPGVYIRALARDVGKCLRTGGYLKKLIRTRVGEFSLKDAYELKNC